MRITPLLLLLLALASPASAASVTLTSGVDNTLYESSDGSLSNGAGLYLFAGTNGSAGGSRIMRSVVAFDLSAIPDAARVDSVELLLEAITPMFRSSTVQVHRLTRDWAREAPVPLRAKVAAPRRPPATPPGFTPSMPARPGQVLEATSTPPSATASRSAETAASASTAHS